MKFVFFSVLENGENGLGDEGADGGNAPPRIFGLEPPLAIRQNVKHYTFFTRSHKLHFEEGVVTYSRGALKLAAGAIYRVVPRGNML